MRRVVLAAVVVLIGIGLAGCITVYPGAASGDLVVVGGNGEVPAGTVVRGSAVVIGGKLEVAGAVQQDAIAIGGTVVVRAGGSVEGETVAVGGRVIVEEGAKLRGNTVSVGLRSLVLPPDQWISRVRAAWPGLWSPRVHAATWIGLLALVLAVVALWGRNVKATSGTIAREPARSALLGLLALFLSPFALVLLVVTIVGIPLLPAVVLLLAAAYVFGFTALADLLGGRLLRLFHVAAPGRHWPAVVGVAGLGLLRLVPVVTGIVGIGITLIGVGGTLASRFGTREPWRPAPPAGGGEGKKADEAVPSGNGGDRA